MLAAGGSTRLGRPKQLITHRGRTLLKQAAQTALDAAIGPVAVVLGAHAELLRREIEGLGVTIVVNRKWSEGIATSIQVGLAAVGAETQPDAALFLTCDQPHVSAELLRRIAGTWASTRPPAVACAYAGTLGVPALLSRWLFEELWLLTGDHGAKKVLEKHRNEVVRLSFEQGAVDIDTAGDVGRLGT